MSAPDELIASVDDCQEGAACTIHPLGHWRGRVEQPVDEPVQFVHPIAGPMPGYVVGRCGHRVAQSEWRAGFRVCERCPDAEEPPEEPPDRYALYWPETADEYARLVVRDDQAAAVLHAEDPDRVPADAHWFAPNSNEDPITYGQLCRAVLDWSTPIAAAIRLTPGGES